MTIETIPTITPARHQRRLMRANSPHSDLWDLLDAVTDPEIPVLSIWDIGILRDVQMNNSQVVVTITPTYSGCPAVDAIKEDTVKALNAGGYSDVLVKITLAPAWTTDDMSDEGQNKLRAYGIAPPGDAPKSCEAYCTPDANVACPNCGSTNTTLTSEFGSTACKALFHCQDCHEPFDFFKNI